MIVTTTPPATTPTPSKPTPPTTPPATPPTTPPPAGPDLGALQQLFTDIATQLKASDETLTKMVADRSGVGARWQPHMVTVATKLLGARDTFMIAKPDAAELSAKLATDVLRLAEAGGSLGIMARQRATLSAGWSDFLDAAIADATAAAALLAPPTPPEPTPPPAPVPPVNPPTPAPAPKQP